jgi:hypothetical protein
MHGRDEKCIQGLVRKPEGKRQFGRPKLDGKIILEWIMEKLGGKMCNRLIWLRTGPMAICYEHCNESSGSIKGGEFIGQLNDY